MPEVAQEAEDVGDVGDGVLVDAKEADPGVEEQEPRLYPFRRRVMR